MVHGLPSPTCEFLCDGGVSCECAGPSPGDRCSGIPPHHHDRGEASFLRHPRHPCPVDALAGWRQRRQYPRLGELVGGFFAGIFGVCCSTSSTIISSSAWPDVLAEKVRDLMADSANNILSMRLPLPDKPITGMPSRNSVQPSILAPGSASTQTSRTPASANTA